MSRVYQATVREETGVIINFRVNPGATVGRRPKACLRSGGESAGERLVIIMADTTSGEQLFASNYCSTIITLHILKHFTVTITLLLSPLYR